MTIIPRPVPTLELSPRHGWVYFIKSDSGHYKIGKSKRPDKRVGEFTLQLPFKVEIIKLIECEDYHRAEQFFHTMCRDYHVNGEWFSLPAEGVEFFFSINSLDDEVIDVMTEGVDPVTDLPKWFYKGVYGDEAFLLKYGVSAAVALYGEPENE